MPRFTPVRDYLATWQILVSDLIEAQIYEAKLKANAYLSAVLSGPVQQVQQVQQQTPAIAG